MYTVGGGLSILGMRMLIWQEPTVTFNACAKPGIELLQMSAQGSSEVSVHRRVSGMIALIAGARVLHVDGRRATARSSRPFAVSNSCWQRDRVGRRRHRPCRRRRSARLRVEVACRTTGIRRRGDGSAYRRL